MLNKITCSLTGVEMAYPLFLQKKMTGDSVVDAMLSAKEYM